MTNRVRQNKQATAEMLRQQLLSAFEAYARYKRSEVTKRGIAAAKARRSV